MFDNVNVTLQSALLVSPLPPPCPPPTPDWRMSPAYNLLACCSPSSVQPSASNCLLFTLKFLPQFFKISYCCYKRTKHFIFALQFTIPFSSRVWIQVYSHRAAVVGDNILKVSHKTSPRYLGFHQITFICLGALTYQENPFNNSGLDFRKQLIVFRTSFSPSWELFSRSC